MVVAIVRPRVVAAPWERHEPGASGAFVGREAEVLPDPGVLAEYLSTWPHRNVVWNAEFQLWEITQYDERVGYDTTIELVYFWDLPPDEETGEMATAEEIDAAVAAQDPTLVMRYRAFDHEFVRKRRQDRFEFFEAGPARRQAKMADRNAAIARGKLRDVKSEQDAGFGEMMEKGVHMEALALAFEKQAELKRAGTWVPFMLPGGHTNPAFRELLKDAYKGLKAPMVTVG